MPVAGVPQPGGRHAALLLADLQGEGLAGAPQTSQAADLSALRRGCAARAGKAEEKAIVTSHSISDGQMKRLQVLYGQLCAHTQQPATREARIGWAQMLVQRPIASFKDLTLSEAQHLIDTAQGQLGIAATRPPRRRLDRDAAHKAGTEGRRGNSSNEITLATAEDLDRVIYVRDLLGWSQAQLDAWLRSPRSPLSNRENPQIRTLKQANRVYWALKGMASRQGKWQPKAPPTAAGEEARNG